MGEDLSNVLQDGETIPLAIVGLAFEFPGEANSEEGFWRMICNGGSASTDFPRDRLNIDAFYHPDKERPSTIPLRAGNFVKGDLGAFDAHFFSVTPREAECMDPQHRRMLETAYHALENDGRCWSFDQRANGYARGEGTAVVIVKRLADALRDGDTIRAVIRNTMSNQDGRTPGITQPNQEAQTNLIEQCYKKAGIDMEPTRFFESHGTGTPVGDPVEANAIGRAFRSYRSSRDPLHIGAVKANIGHLEGCSGLAGLIKTILVLEHGVIPPIAGFTSLNSQIDAQGLHLNFPKTIISWPKSTVRRACVNSFGFGGTNAIAILDDAYHHLQQHGLNGYHHTHFSPMTATPKPRKGTYPMGDIATNAYPRMPKLLLWSATEQGAAQKLSDAYSHYLRRVPRGIDDLAYALTARRSQFTWRSYLVTDDIGTIDSSEPPPPVRANKGTKIAFLFTGQGAQFRGMGKSLVAFPAFRNSLLSSEACLKELGCQWSLPQIIDGTCKDPNLDLPDYSQPLTTCLQIALVDLLEAFDIAPSIVLGHSSGEIAAAYAAGALTRSAAIKVAYYRGKLSSRVAGNGRDLTMMVVGLSRHDIIPYLERLKSSKGSLNVQVGCVNSPQSITLTGNASQLAELDKWLRENSVLSRRLKVPVAYHSSFMNEISSEYSAAIGALEKGQVRVPTPMISSVTGDIVTPNILTTAEYWSLNLTSIVEFEKAYSRLIAYSNKKPAKQLGKSIVQDLRVTHVLEVGPHSALQGPVRENAQVAASSKALTYIPTLKRGEDASVALLKAVGALHCAGYPANILLANCLQNSKRPLPEHMPKYPFNHKQSHWNESRLSKNFRFREYGRHDLLGTRTLDWNPQMAVWRNIIRLAELPWLGDHRVNNDIVMPGTGMLVMAMEAIRELVGDSSSLYGIQIKDAIFLHAISFRGRDNVESQLTLSSCPDKSSYMLWHQFRLFVIEGGQYIECSRGYIRPVVDARDRSRTASSASFLGKRNATQWVRDTSKAVDDLERDLYALTAGSAVRYGSFFRNLEQVRLGNSGQAIANLSTKSWKTSHCHSMFPRPFMVHPATLDGFAQLIVPTLAQKHGSVYPMMPTRAADVWVDCSNDQWSQGDISVAIQCSLRGYRGASADIIGICGDSGRPLVYFQGLETTFIENVKSMAMDQVQPRQLFQHYRSLMVGVMCYVEEALAFVDRNPTLNIDRHLKRYVAWMKYQHQQLCSGRLSSAAKVRQLLSDHEKREELQREVKESGVEGLFFMHLGQNLVQILSGAVEPLDLMYSDGLANRYYEAMLGNEHHTHPASAYIDLLCFKNPSMNIIEIGAGTGGQTMNLLKAMSRDGVKKWARYDFTDSSPGFFPQARAKFQEFSDQMEFRVFDVSRDPVSQSFKAGSYDLVVASHVLHATDVMREALRYVRKLLKPDGKLLLFETTKPDVLHIGFGFGLLKGWWSPLDHESRSENSPCLTSEQWDAHLKSTGFSGIDVEIPGQEECETRYSSIIISSAVRYVDDGVKLWEEIALVIDEQVQTQVLAARLLEEHLPTCKIYTLAEIAQADRHVLPMVVFLLEVNTIFIDGISEINYKLLHSALIKSQSVLWITKPASGRQEPRLHLVEGLGRVLMSEDSKRKFVTVSLSQRGQDPEDMLTLITELVDRIAKAPVDALETIYIEREGTLNIARISENFVLDRMISKSIMPRQKQECALTVDTQFSLQITSPGHLDTLEWMETDEALGRSSLDPDEVLVIARTVGLTFRDHLIASGQINELDLGTECAGVIQAAGALAPFRVGDRVCAIGPSMARSLIRCKSSAVVHIPPEMDYSEASSMCSAFWLAYHSLVNVANLQEGETVLVSQGNSCVGQMATQLAKSLGATVLTTVESAEKGEFLHRELGLPKDAIFCYDEDSLGSKILQRTQGQGFDVVLGPPTNDRRVQYSAYLAPFGRLVDIDITGRTEMKIVTQHTQQRNTSKASVDMVDLLKRKPAMAHRVFQEAMKMFSEKQLKPPQPLHVFSADNIEAAFRHYQDNTFIGKRVLELTPGMTIIGNIKTKPRYTFPADATYVIAGGLGGLGRSFARWMVSRGARNLILLSRSGAASIAAKGLVRELKEQGVRVVTPPVDIGALGKLKCVLGELAKHMPPIRGCIQATLALRDNLFENMTYEDWTISTTSKVTGSWNLHKALPQDLDFFVLISSVNGIFGSRAQANYAAGNTFKDALAHHRIACGQKAVAIDLGLMVEAGRVAEDEALLASMRRIGLLMDIQQEEMLALLEFYCDPSLPILRESEAQVVVGVELPSVIQAKGIDLHHSLHRPMFRQLFKMSSTNAGSDSCANSDGTVGDRVAALRSAPSQDDAAILVKTWLTIKLGQVLGLTGADIDSSKPLHAYGIDSLVAIDLKNWFASKIGADFEVFDILGNISLDGLSIEAAKRSRARHEVVILS
ncbi:hypothetical protein DL765_009915 [Monosporascus sp. GIB2]|nr:hypothetical protein DL765_009915 [Monosporascus sp. GIB2]